MSSYYSQDCTNPSVRVQGQAKVARPTLTLTLTLTLHPHCVQDCTNLTGVLEKRKVPSVSLEVLLRGC